MTRWEGYLAAVDEENSYIASKKWNSVMVLALVYLSIVAMSEEIGD